MAKYSLKKNLKKKRSIPVAIMNVSATFNNTIVSICDPKGNIICWSSTGAHGFKGSRKATPYAAQVTTRHAINNAKNFGVQTISVVINGPGIGRESCLRELLSDSDINVTSIKDKTLNPHNGCRPPKRRRV